MTTKIIRLSPTAHTITRILDFRISVTAAIGNKNAYGLNPRPLEFSEKDLLLYAAQQKFLYACVDADETMLGYIAGYLPGIFMRIQNDFVKRNGLFDTISISSKSKEWLRKKYIAALSMGCKPYIVLVDTLVDPTKDQQNILQSLFNELWQQGHDRRDIQTGYFVNENGDLSIFLQKIGFVVKKQAITNVPSQRMYQKILVA